VTHVHQKRCTTVGLGLWVRNLGWRVLVGDGCRARLAEQEADERLCVDTIVGADEEEQELHRPAMVTWDGP